MRNALKGGVDIAGIRSECIVGLLVASQVFEARGVPFIVTSVRDSKHSEKSLHYVGAAFDCRLASRYTKSPETDKRILEDLKESLGAQFDVVLEGDHFHVEFDPK
jgi:hypothetical protein